MSGGKQYWVLAAYMSGMELVAGGQACAGYSIQPAAYGISAVGSSSSVRG